MIEEEGNRRRDVALNSITLTAAAGQASPAGRKAVKLGLLSVRRCAQVCPPRTWALLELPGPDAEASRAAVSPVGGEGITTLVGCFLRVGGRSGSR